MTPAFRLLIAFALASAGVTATGCGYKQTFGVESLDGGAGVSSKTGAGSVVITVIDASSQPVAGAAVGIKDATGKAVAAEVTTDASGKATFKLPAGRSYTAVARNAGVTATHNLDVEGEGGVIVSILLAEAGGLKGMLTGSVIDAMTGQALHGATVGVLGVQTSTKSAADGSFTLAKIPVGSPTLVVTYPGFREMRMAVAVAGGQSGRVDVKLQPGSNPQRLGHTLIATQAAVVEVDKVGSKLWSTKKGGAQARLLPNGNVLIATGSRVDEVTPAGAVAWAYKPGVFGVLSDVQGAFRAASGNTFIADTGNSRVIEVSTSQQITRAVKIDLERPMSVERVEATHTTLIADTGHNRVVEVNDAGQIVWGFGDGDAATLNRPTHATRLPNGNTLVTDTGNSRVLEITREAKLQWMYGGDGQRATCFLPNSSTRLPNGNTLIADTGNHRVIEVTPGETPELAWKFDVEAPLYAERL